jgi:hypothetical protein
MSIDYVKLIIDLVRSDPGMYNYSDLIKEVRNYLKDHDLDNPRNVRKFVKKAMESGRIEVSDESVVPGIKFGRRYWPT